MLFEHRSKSKNHQNVPNESLIKCHPLCLECEQTGICQIVSFIGLNASLAKFGRTAEPGPGRGFESRHTKQMRKDQIRKKQIVQIFRITSRDMLLVLQGTVASDITQQDPENF